MRSRAARPARCARFRAGAAAPAQSRDRCRTGGGCIRARAGRADARACRADRHRAGALQQAHDRGIGTRRPMVRMDRRAGARRQRGRVEDVLHDHRQAGQRPLRARGGSQRGVAIQHRAQGTQHAVHGIDARERIGHGREPAVAIGSPPSPCRSQASADTGPYNAARVSPDAEMLMVSVIRADARILAAAAACLGSPWSTISPCFRIALAVEAGGAHHIERMDGQRQLARGAPRRRPLDQRTGDVQALGHADPDRIGSAAQRAGPSGGRGWNAYPSVRRSFGT